MYQHWALDKGNFKVSLAAQTMFGRIKEFVNKLMGNWTNSERALHIMEYFNSGEYANNASRPSVVRRALMETNKSQALESAKNILGPLDDVGDLVNLCNSLNTFAGVSSGDPDSYRVEKVTKDPNIAAQ